MHGKMAFSYKLGETQYFNGIQLSFDVLYHKIFKSQIT